MKFKLTRQIVNKEILHILKREALKNKEFISPATKTQQKQLSHIVQIISKEALPKHLVKKKLMHNLGHGIFLKPDSKPIEKGEVIAPYSGVISLVPSNDPSNSGYMFEVLSNITLNKEEQYQIHPKRKYHPKRLYSFHLEAVKKGNFTRFINHSEKPNVVAYLISTPTKSEYGLDSMPVEVIYIAKKKIMPGEQLLISYENDGENNYWAPFKIKPFPMNPKTFTLLSNGKLRSLA